MTGEPSVFITGTQRSGTTLLCRILNVHPDILIFNEIFSMEEWDTILPQEQCLEKLLLCLDQKNVSINKKRWGVKNPYLTYHFDNLWERFPNSKIIIMIRDGRAVGNSYIHNKWGTTNTYYGAKRWQKELALQKDFMEKHPDTCYLSKYENLVLNPENELKKICPFLGIDYDKEMLNYYNYTPPFEENKFNINTKKNFDSNIVDKWRNELSAFQINVFETIAGDTLEENGYKLIGQPIKISPILKLWFWLQQVTVGELQIQYQWRLRGIIRKYFEKKKNSSTGEQL